MLHLSVTTRLGWMIYSKNEGEEKIVEKPKKVIYNPVRFIRVVCVEHARVTRVIGSVFISWRKWRLFCSLKTWLTSLMLILRVVLL